MIQRHNNLMSSYVVIMFIKYEDGDSSYMVNNHDDSEVMMMMIPMDVTLVGIVTDVIEVHPSKALYPYE